MKPQPVLTFTHKKVIYSFTGDHAEKKMREKKIALGLIPPGEPVKKEKEGEKNGR